MSLHTRLSRARRRAKLTQTELAKRTGFWKSAICEWESGKREPSLAQLRDLAHELDVDIAELLA